MVQEGHSRKAYPSDLTDEQWAIVEPLIPPAKQRPRGGRPREVDMREVLKTIFYLHRSGCQWDMLPHDVLPKSTVYDDFAQWRDDGTWAKIVKALRERTRVAAGREPTPSAACIDSQSVKTTEIGGPARGYDGGKNIKGRKRHLLVDTLGLLIAVLITSAGLDDGVAAPLLLGVRFSASRHDLCGYEVSQSRPRSLDGSASCGVAPRSEDTSRGHERLHTPGETLGGGAHERLEWSVP